MLQHLPFPVIRPLNRGAYADTLEVTGPTGPAVLKIAHAGPASAGGAAGDTLALDLEQPIEFVTGGVGTWAPEPNALLDAEGAILARVDHPLFVRLLEQGEVVEDGQPRRYLLLEKIAGRTWREALGSDAPPSFEDFRALVEGLAALHKAGKLAYHGDLKPENLFLTPQGAVRVIDPSSGVTELDAFGEPRRMLVTEFYNPLYAASDLPALGVLMAEVLTGQNLWHIAAESAPIHAIGPALSETLRGASMFGRDRVLRYAPSLPLPTALRPGLSRAAEATILRCMGLQRTDDGLEQAERPFADVGELAAELARYGR